MSAYITPAELAALGGVSSAFIDRAVAKLGPTAVAEAIAAASSILDDAVRAQYSTPLTTVSDGTKLRVAHIAVYLLASRIGVPPEGLDTWLMSNYQDAMRWLDGVSSGKIVPVIVDQTPSIDEGAPAVVFSCPPRGW